MKNKKGLMILGFIGLLILQSCSNSIETQQNTNLTENNTGEVLESQGNESLVEDQSNITDKYPDWTVESHSNDSALDYDTVFPQEEVNRIDIVISEENWEKVSQSMESTYGEFGNSNSRQSDETVEDATVYVESDIYFDDTQWYNVGFKLKGHSSLKSAWSEGNYKLPFKLDFDEFEDNYVELNNQRFYGFKKLSFSSNYNDDSLLHEKLASESFEQAGLVVPTTAFYAVYLNYGNGPVYTGLYTAVEVIDDTVVDKFGDDSGNIYEAEGQGVTLAPETYDMIETHYEKKNNEETSDWSDIQELSEILNSDLRLSDSEQWRASLEEVFDVDVFLQWLAVNSTIQNWDTYGVMTHNFYLYNNPETGKLTWIPWDNNESFSPGKQGLITLTANSAGDNWPLIRYILDEETYKEQYIEYVHEFNDTVLNTEEFDARIEFLHDLISPYVIGDNGEISSYSFLRNETAFTQSLETLRSFIDGRIIEAGLLSLDDDWSYSAISNVRGAGNRGGEIGEDFQRPERIPGEQTQGEGINPDREDEFGNNQRPEPLEGGGRPQ